MKLEDLKPGMRILIPCPTCTKKKSIKFHSVEVYLKAKTKPCDECRRESFASNMAERFSDVPKATLGMKRGIGRIA